jgi:protein-S-isoprenylcysteine O-methyltransferase Ste14
MDYAHGHGHDRDDLTGEARGSHTVQLTAAVAFFVVWIVDSFVLSWTTFLNGAIPDGIQLLVGLPLLVLAGYLAIASMRTVFGEQRDPPTVIRTGLFAHMRHPMYFAQVLVYVGLTVLSASLAAGVITVGAAAALARLCRYEERLLIERFGEEYRRYMREVPMWIPRLRRR